MESNDGFIFNLSWDGDPVSPDAPSKSQLVQFSEWYANLHGYTSLAVCVFGIITNIFNITVLTRSDMTTPTNVLLTWLAVSDIWTMIPYIPFALHFYCIHSPFVVSPEKNSYLWMSFMLVLISFTATTHTISIWLGVAIAVLRYLQLKSTANGVQANKKRIKTAKIIAGVIYVVSIAGLIPNYLSNELETRQIDIQGVNRTIYVLKDLKLNSGDADLIVLLNVICYGLFAKVVPCVLMSVYGGALLYNLGVKGNQRRRRLSRMTSLTSTAEKRRTGRVRTTKMLLTVLILFLLTELPQGILILLSVGMKGFFFRIYIPLGDLMDFIALLNNAVNFVLYCTMSHQFRIRFLQMFGQSSIKFRGSFRNSVSIKCAVTNNFTNGTPPKRQSTPRYGVPANCNGKPTITRINSKNGTCQTQTIEVV